MDFSDGMGILDFWVMGDWTCIFSLVVLFLLVGWFVGHEVKKY